MPEGAFYGQEGGRRLRRGVVQQTVVEPMLHDPTGSPFNPKMHLSCP
jgi:hypothetical protein